MKKISFFIAILFAAAGTVCQAQTQIGRILFQDDKWSPYAQVDGRYLYILLKYGSLESIKNEIAVWDIGNPDRPVQAGVIPLDFLAHEFLKTGDNLYVFASPSYSDTTKIQAINVANPARPVIRGTIVANVVIYELRVKPGASGVLLCRYQDNSSIDQLTCELDISNPAAMKISPAGTDLKNFNQQQAGDLVFGSQNLGTDYDKPNVVFYISDSYGKQVTPAAVKLEGVEADFDYYMKSGNTLFGVMGGGDGLARIASINITDPKRPALLKYINLYETFTDIRLWGVQCRNEFLYFAGITGTDGKYILRLMKTRADSLASFTAVGKTELAVTSDSRVWLFAADKCLVAVHSTGATLFSY